MTIITHSPHPFQVWKNNLQLQYLLFVKLFCQLQYLLFAWHPIGTRGVSSFPRLPLPQRRRREVPRRRDWPTVRGGSCDIACLRGADGHVERSPLKRGAGFFGSDELGKNEDENYTSVKCLIQVRGGGSCSFRGLKKWQHLNSNMFSKKTLQNSQTARPVQVDGLRGVRKVSGHWFLQTGGWGALSLGGIGHAFLPPKITTACEVGSTFLDVLMDLWGNNCLHRSSNEMQMDTVWAQWF